MKMVTGKTRGNEEWVPTIGAANSLMLSVAPSSPTEPAVDTAYTFGLV